MAVTESGIRKSVWDAINKSPFDPSVAFSALFPALPEVAASPRRAAARGGARAARPLLPTPFSPSATSADPPTVAPPTPAPPFVYAPDSPRRVQISRGFAEHPLQLGAAAGEAPLEGPEAAIAWVTELPVPAFDFDLEGRLVLQPLAGPK
jgi:hypothetical protein